MQTLTTIRSLLAEAGLRPNKKLGQHFLIDGNLMRKFVGSAGIGSRDTVLEVGCGTGSLTQDLAELAGGVVAVEADRGVGGIAAEQLVALENVVLIREDVLESKTRIAPAVLEAVVEARGRLGGRFLLVANLPYQIASPLIVDLLVGEIVPERMCVTVQKEVGDRLSADPGGGQYGPLSVIVQALAEVRRIAVVGPQAFWPRPAVESSMLLIEASPDLREAVGDVRHFAEVVKTCFLHRRKTLSHNLTVEYGAATAQAALAKMGVDPKARPEALGPGQWVALAKAV
ncbi:MAG: ribosomal RNA small subunit methyltransferase A [Phycisphaerae bacterium]|nr:ribosomal RNA small subunit methyltransferase A [Phycisphaerae bacterium]